MVARRWSLHVNVQGSSTARDSVSHPRGDHERKPGAGLGIDSARVRLITFAIGCGLAALAGALITPLSSVDPNMGVPWLISAFMLVMVSGGSLLTLGVSCLVLGGAAGARFDFRQPHPRRTDHRRAGRRVASAPAGGFARA